MRMFLAIVVCKLLRFIGKLASTPSSSALTFWVG